MTPVGTLVGVIYVDVRAKRRHTELIKQQSQTSRYEKSYDEKNAVVKAVSEAHHLAVIAISRAQAHSREYLRENWSEESDVLLNALAKFYAVTYDADRLFDPTSPCGKALQNLKTTVEKELLETGRYVSWHAAAESVPIEKYAPTLTPEKLEELDLRHEQFLAGARIDLY